ncbi:hypothetical protein KU48_14965 [Bacillus safensis]|nr:hypothetical protein KU48_14965 [Bacillus safensis]
MFLRSNEIKCSKCNGVIKTNDKFVAIMTMPSSYKQPYGTMDAVLKKISDVVICLNCSNSEKLN